MEKVEMIKEYNKDGGNYLCYIPVVGIGYYFKSSNMSDKFIKKVNTGIEAGGVTTRKQIDFIFNGIK